MGEELGGEVVDGYRRVMRREVVALEAERADPDLGGEIDDGEGVEDGSAGAAAERGVGEEGRGRAGGEGFERGVDGGDGDDAVVGFLLGAWDYIPWHSDAILGLEFHEFRHLNHIYLSLALCFSLECERGRTGEGRGFS